MSEDLDEALDRQVRQLTREVADLTRQVEHERKMRGFLEDQVQRLETSVHQKMSRAELVGWAWAVVPLVVGPALFISLIVSRQPHAS